MRTLESQAATLLVVYGELLSPGDIPGTSDLRNLVVPHGPTAVIWTITSLSFAHQK